MKVARQLFKPLLSQLIHWFTTHQMHGRPGTAVLMDAIMVCCVWFPWSSLSLWEHFLLTSESRRPFPQESVGFWRKVEIQWMTFALVGDRKGKASGLKIYSPVITHGTFFPATSLSLHCCPFSGLRKTWWVGVKEDVWSGRVHGETG